MIKKFISTVLVFALIGVTVGAIHFVLVSKLTLFLSIPVIYVFNYLMSLVSLGLVFLIHKYFSDKVGFAFLGLGLVKMAVSLVFLMPLIDSSINNKIPDTLNFFWTYFLFLLAESVVTVRMLNKK